ncbi:hypothetical protein IM816_05885 [Luteibacter flocculans]|uniref:Uncharacterized protein n=1 Tax=Luteibacter flocculans TaxID=2780091 RepID=A0ABY4TA82_9GAMM|nr:hypothetical protein [Luteibacter flocculans]URL59626.1 hypothetical protein IM816_05885 [Luteibacter flocculans]
MADPIFPAALPAVRVGDGYGYQPVSPFARTNMDSGLARQRRRFVSVPTTVTAKLRLTTTQLGTFESFFWNDLNAGVSWFVVPLVNGRGMNSVRARITEAPATAGTESPDVWDVSLKLETLSLPVAS